MLSLFSLLHRFYPPFGTDEDSPNISMNIDSTASYITMADSLRNVNTTIWILLNL